MRPDGSGSGRKGALVGRTDGPRIRAAFLYFFTFIHVDNSRLSCENINVD